MPIEAEQTDLFAYRIHETHKADWPTEDVISWCNEIRDQKGLEPLLDLPLGIPGNECCCPIGRAIQGQIQPSSGTYNGGHNDLPQHVADWARDFDHGAHTEYVDPIWNAIVTGDEEWEDFPFVHIEGEGY